jgi:hypothetical protein
MDAEQLAALTVRDLEPLLASSATVGPAQVQRRKLGGRGGPGNRMWISIPGGLEVTLTRSLPLSVWEARLLEPYGNALSELGSVPDAFAPNAADEVSLRAIAAQIGAEYSSTVESAIRFLLRCAVTTYEGQPVHLNVLLDLDRPSGDAVVDSLDQFRGNDWYAVLGSGLETGVVVDRDGGIVEVQDIRLHQGAGAPGDNALRPDVFRLMGDWTAEGNRIALSLARSRELLIHQGGLLRYVYRAGSWRGLPLDVALRTGWSAGASTSWPLKQAMLASAIDASLGHHGASLAVVVRGRKNDFAESGAIEAMDLWPAHIRAKLFPSQGFLQLTRRQRLELLSMDGATVLDHTGRILTAGAIVEVPGGSTGGGRLAATRALARFGAAFKVSQDGPITLFGRASGGEVEQVMALA